PDAERSCHDQPGRIQQQRCTDAGSDRHQEIAGEDGGHQAASGKKQRQVVAGQEKVVKSAEQEKEKYDKKAKAKRSDGVPLLLRRSRRSCPCDWPGNGRNGVQCFGHCSSVWFKWAQIDIS